MSAKGAGDRDAASDQTLELGLLRHDIGFQIHITRRAIWAGLRALRGNRHGKRKPSGYMSTLLLVGNNPGVSLSEIAHVLAIEMPNMVVIMRMLEDEKLVERKVNPADRRRLSFSLTPAGEKRFEEVSQMAEANSQMIGHQLTESERATLVELLGKVRASVAAFHNE